MKLLLDRCAIFWLAVDQTWLSPTARQTIGEHLAAIFVSAISAFEISLKHRKGRLDRGMEPAEW